MEPDLFLRRFWAKVDIAGPDECWLWRGAQNSRGYGQVWREGKRPGAHCIAFASSGVRIPPRRVVRHSCDVPPCCNPRHLSLGTQADNLREMVERGRSARGERNARARLSMADVDHIRALCDAGELQREAARRYGVTQQQVSKIIRGENWHV